MSTLLVSLPQLHVVRLDVRVSDSEWTGFTHLQVFRSTTGEDGIYEELTGSRWSYAQLPEDGTVPSFPDGKSINIAGKTLTITVGDEVLPVTFSGPDPRSYAQCAAQINGACSPLAVAWVDTNGLLVVSSGTGIGGRSSLSVSGDAAVLLGLPVGETAFGKDPRPVLIKGQTVYRFTDYFGKASYYYKTRFYDETSQAVSAFSPPLCGGSRDDVPSENIAVGYVRFTDAQGKAQRNVRVVAYVEPQTSDVTGRLVTGAPIEKLSDENGYAEFSLIQGVKVRIVVPDMGMVREITVPAVAQFSLLEPGIGSNDAFDVRRIAIAFGERRSL